MTRRPDRPGRYPMRDGLLILFAIAVACATVPLALLIQGILR